MTPQRAEWIEKSRHALAAALDDLRARIAAKSGGPATAASGDIAPEVSALARISRRFRLSPFERDVLLITAGVEVDSGFAEFVTQARGESPRSRPTFALALSLLDHPHWDALSPYGVLRRARLVRLAEGTGLVDAPITIEEPVLHALNGLSGIDERLRPFVRVPDGGPLVPSQERAALQLTEVWGRQTNGAPRHKALLAGSSRDVAIEIFVAACRQLEVSPFVFDVAALPSDRAQLEDLVDLWERDAVLHDLALLIDVDAAESPERRSVASWLLDRLSGFVVVAGSRVPASGSAAVAITVGEMTAAEQASIWQVALGPLADRLDGHLGRLTEQFRLPVRAIVRAVAELQANPEDEPAVLAERAWDLCRRQARGGLEDLAERIEPRATWDRLVLPAAQMDLLRSIATQVRHRYQVYEGWGFRTHSSRGFGVSALFHGPSGVGKTFAAEVLAQDLALDLYRVDLSATISKYIGETEKNLRRIFDAAEESGAILLFDEADALFGKRSEVSNSHDRYANIEVSYLLQRMEAYRGLAILTTNLKSALDSAFLRRLRFVVPFPFPSAAERERIWRHAFPTDLPLDPAVDWTKLARLAVAGGNIANIALDAAFRAADQGAVVSMPHLLAAARTECAKIEKSITDNETRGWL